MTGGNIARIKINILCVVDQGTQPNVSASSNWRAAEFLIDCIFFRRLTAAHITGMMNWCVTPRWRYQALGSALSALTSNCGALHSASGEDTVPGDPSGGCRMPSLNRRQRLINDTIYKRGYPKRCDNGQLPWWPGDKIDTRFSRFATLRFARFPGTLTVYYNGARFVR